MRLKREGNGMAAPNKGGPVRMTLVVGGDPFLNDQKVREIVDKVIAEEPETEPIELDAETADRYAFDEATGPSLFGSSALVVMRHMESADEGLSDAMQSYCKDSGPDVPSGIVIAQHAGGPKGRGVLNALVKAGARKEEVPDLKRADAKLNFVIQRFERERRHIEPAAAQQLVAVLGDRTGELAAMCSQLCFDFESQTINLDQVNQYLSSNPTVTGFTVADTALAGNVSGALTAMRSAVAQGTDPIALVGALAMKLRTLAKASAVRSGTISQAEAKTNPWVLKNAMRQLSGWTSVGLSHCIQTLAWVDEQNKTNGGDPFYALERAIVLIGMKGQREI
jgi:DNA polymerase III subunit delta